MAEPVLHITVGAAPESGFTTANDFGVTLAHDMRLVKAALLYADQVTLCSVAGSLVQAVLSAKDLTADEFVDLVMAWAPFLTDDPDNARAALASLRYAAKRPPQTDEQIVDKLFHEGLLHKPLREWRRKMTELHAASGVEELQRAIATGLVELRPLDGDAEAMTLQYFEFVKEAVTDGQTYPLFDEPTGGLVRASIRDGVLSVSGVRTARGRHIGLAANLLERLPLFDEASVDEVVDIRRELDRPLQRFRGAVIGFSRKINGAAWDEDFPQEAEQTFLEDVQPAVLEIEDLVKAGRFRTILARQAGDKAIKVVTVSSLGMLLTKLATLPDLVLQSLGSVAAGALGATGTGAALLYDSVREWQQKKADAEEKQLYFYYRAGERLSDAR